MSLRVGEVATAAGVNRETLRYYERRGLLGPPGPVPRRTPAVRRAGRHHAPRHQSRSTAGLQPR